MSLKQLLGLLFILLIAGCNDRTTSFENKIADLTEKERDSLTDMYHEYSMLFYQPSEMHRKYKDTALIISPDHVEYRQRLSYSYKKTGEHIKAMEILNEAVRRDIKNNKTGALGYRAWSLLFFYRDYEGTVKDVDLINKMEPNNDYTICHGEPCNLLKGQALYKMGRYKKAIQIFKSVQAVERGKGWGSEGSFATNFYKARCYAELKNYEQAIAIYKAQIAKNDKLTEVYYQLGRIYNILGNKENAKKHLEMARALLSEGYQMGEPYYEAFDEVFLYQIQDELDKT